MLDRSYGFRDGFLQRVHGLLKREVERINDHLPKESKTLKELLAMEEPKVTTRAGDDLVMEKSELELLERLLPEKYHERLKLPIVILRMIGMGEGVYMICGSDAEVQAIESVLGSRGAVHQHQGKAFLYKPYVAILKGKLRTTTVIGFIPTEEGVLTPCC
ncbi:MAG: DUF61 family protein [Candidatus Nezhaarchaeota archaeon]|nr:DUF61 family protein [Candidatus Nezhaarchaeota archaeon]